MSQIRLTKTTDIDKVLGLLQKEYPLLNDAEIIKLSLSIAYKKLSNENVYRLNDEEERDLGIALKELEEGKGFKGSADEAIEWLNK